jgi:hypothetical protein
MRIPRRLATSRSTPAELGRLGQIFGLCEGPYAFTIHHHSRNHKIKGTPSFHKKCLLLRWREHSRLSGHDTLLRWREHLRLSGQDKLLRSREYLRVRGHETSYKWMKCWQHNLRLCPLLAKCSHCGANQYPCLESLMIT